MSHFSETLRALLASQGLTQDQLAEDSGVDRTLISRMLRTRVPTRDQLAKLCAAISPDARVRAELLVAHLRDEAADTFRRAGLDKRHVLIEPTDPSNVAESPAPSPFESWPIQLRTELVLIAEESLRIPEMRAMVGDLAALVERSAAERHSPAAMQEGPGETSDDVIEEDLRSRQRRSDKKSS